MDDGLLLSYFIFWVPLVRLPVIWYCMHSHFRIATEILRIFDLLCWRPDYCCVAVLVGRFIECGSSYLEVIVVDLFFGLHTLLYFISIFVLVFRFVDDLPGLVGVKGVIFVFISLIYRFFLLVLYHKTDIYIDYK